MTDLNMERVSPHDDIECAQGMDRLRGERDLARSVAVSLEQEVAHLTELLNREYALCGRLTARLVAHGIALPGDDDDVRGTPV
jgi:hypothetical protein